MFVHIEGVEVEANVMFLLSFPAISFYFILDNILYSFFDNLEGMYNVS